jgi:hypothetical protein
MLSAFAGTAFTNSQVPPQKHFFLGGSVSAPGYNYHEFAGTSAANLRTEWRLPVPFPSIALGRYGKTPASATLSPFVGSAYVADPAAWSDRAAGFYPYAGVGLSMFFDILHVNVGRGLRDGRWTFSFDIMREFWSIL